MPLVPRHLSAKVTEALACSRVVNVVVSGDPPPGISPVIFPRVSDVKSRRL